MGKFIDRTGQRFGKLTVLKFAGMNRLNQSNWLCLCDCGKEEVIFSGNLKSGHTTSCGCAKREANLKHGEGGAINFVNRSPEYQTLASILQRCLNPQAMNYKDYGGRGIKVFEDWNSLHKFPAFLAYVGRRPTPKHSIDRWPDKNGNYEPGNVRWATTAEQARNTRRNIFVTIDGHTACFKDMCKRYGKGHSVVKKRLRYGWDLESAFKEPIADKFRNLKYRANP